MGAGDYDVEDTVVGLLVEHVQLEYHVPDLPYAQRGLFPKLSSIGCHTYTVEPV